ncbi:MAG: Hsp33 family molecular chaperone HslO [Candidatus Kapabacteria bacterium]|nr:Hsp33 family molecular chaperone HslO [Candidatus Kapabacteria bacterium]
MTERELKKLYQHRDRVVRGITTDGKFRVAVTLNTAIAQEAARRHNAEPAAALLLARALSGAALLSSFLKGEERIIVETMGNGVYKKIFAEALQVGEVRGYVEKNRAPAMLDDALGAGMMRVTKILYGKFEPVSGLVELRKGNITTDLAYYLTQSEQIPSAVRLDVRMDGDGAIQYSTGLLVQAMPGATDAEIMSVQNSIIEVGDICELAASGYGAEEIIKQVIPQDVEVLNNTPIDFYCRCSLDRFKSILVSLGLAEVENMHAAGHNELVCQYCNEHYTLSDNDFAELITQLRAQQN